MNLDCMLMNCVVGVARPRTDNVAAVLWCFKERVDEGLLECVMLYVAYEGRIAGENVVTKVG